MLASTLLVTLGENKSHGDTKKLKFTAKKVVHSTFHLVGSARVRGLWGLLLEGLKVAGQHLC